MQPQFPPPSQRQPQQEQPFQPQPSQQPNPVMPTPFAPAQSRFTANDLPIPGRCGTQAKDRIVGGTETSILDFPW